MKYFSNVTRIVACLFVLLISNFFGFGARADDCVLGTAGCDPEFTITTTDTSDFSFKISAAGTYYLDCGNGDAVRTINKTSTGAETFTCANRTSTTIGLSGQATKYSSNVVAAISFKNNTKIKTVNGSLGAIFSGNTPYMFFDAFCGCTNLESIPKTLFEGVTGSAKNMFSATFYDCSSLKSLPSELFSGVSGGAEYMFQGTFSNCVGLTSIPSDLFSGITSSAKNMFQFTFNWCTGLTELPNGLFKNMSGAPVSSTFNSTFSDCANLSGYIPSDMFANLSTANFDTTSMSNIFVGTALDTQCPAGTTQYITGFESAWGGRVSCSPAPSCPNGQMLVDGECIDTEFTITTTDTSDFSFTISAAGTYYLDCGNGEGVRTINKTSTGNETFYCTNRTSTTIGLSGDVTAYNNDWWGGPAAISFESNKEIKSVDGSLGAIFGGSSDYMFYNTFAYCTSLESIPEKLFSGVSGSAYGMFNSTFYGCTSLQSIPENLFSGVSGSSESMFSSTFRGCTSLQSIPENLFSGVSGSSENMFASTFAGCTSLTSIPENLFAGVTGSAYYMFASTFAGCTSLESIPENLFAGVSGSARTMFYSTFSGCTSLTSIPENLFSGVTGSSEYMFYETFRDCTSLESIPKNLFAGISGSAESMFYETFYGCTSLTSIPENLFSGVSGSADWMFYSTFEDCSSLKSIPSGLFDGVTGTADYMFAGTFGKCTSLTKLPNGLFKNITGEPRGAMFRGMFAGCTNLSGYIPADMFASLSSDGYMESKEWISCVPWFLDCPGGTADTDARAMDYMFLDTNLDTTCPAGTTQYVTGFEDDWSGKVSCVQSCPSGQMLVNDECVEFTPEFTITTTDTSDFSFSISAAGTYYLDCGNGDAVRTIDKTSTGAETITCTNRTSTTIGLSGDATGYTSSWSWVPAISFSGNTKIKTVDGSLGAIFGGSSEFMFYNTFYGCTSLTSIPENLFSGVSGSADWMFYETFYGCTSLTSIPENLFAGVSGSAYRMFNSTFSGCTSLESIPSGLFDGITGTADFMFAGTFAKCTSLTELPNGLFKNITGEPRGGMFRGTFAFCDKLSGYIPSNMFESLSNDGYEDSADWIECMPWGLGLECRDGSGTTARAMNSMFVGTNLDTSCPAGTTQYITGFESDWSGKVACVKSCSSGQVLVNDECVEFTPEFTMTTTSDTSSFSFRISAAGTYYLDCGNGDGVRTIDKTSTGAETFTCSYANAGVHTIGLSGQATEYASTINPAAIDFKENTKLAGISGSLGAIFGTLPNNEYKVPSFYNAFSKCTNLKGNIPAELFAGVNGQPREFMFYKTFYGCHQLTGSIPENLFAGIKGKPVQYLFGDTFSKIVDTSSTTYPLMQLTGEIPENLFAGIEGAPAEAMFKRTFYGCAGLTGSIPENLFAGLDGAPAKELFHTTFRGCSGLTGEIPENLFAGIKGAPAVSMFESTFASELASKHGDKALMKLSGAIPENLFGGISGAPADRMFYNTFYRCEKLTKIPAGLFAGIKGAPATDMMDWMFEWCTGLTEFVPPELFAGITSTNYTAGAMSGIFESSNMATSCPSGYAQFITGFESDWGTKNGKTAVSCINFEPEFTVTTTKLAASATFDFKIAPQGTYYINWGDGKAEKIVKTDTVATTYSHKYTNAGTYTIGIMGQAEKYDTSVKNAAISFEGKTNIAGIGGSLGAIFGTLTNGNTPKQPTFYASFYKCSNLKGEIPADLFKGISGQPRDYMFYKLFRGCSGLTGEIPANLFADLKGEPRAYMFADTFAKLSGGTPMGFTGTIPANLFGGISGAPADRMFYNTFYGCEKLTGTIPETLFAGIKGAPANMMMAYTFEECKGLDGFVPPELFAGIKNTNYATGPMTDVFLNSGLDTTCPAGYSLYKTGFESDFDGKVSCIDFEPEFTMTTTSDTKEFSFTISAAGTYYLKCNNGESVRIINKENTDVETITCSYDTAGVHTIELAGQATEYGTSVQAAIGFKENKQLAGISGNLGAIFGKVTEGTYKVPSFYFTFYKCTNLKGEIPADLFGADYGQPRKYMFYKTFFGCSELTGSIPEDLFAGVYGEPVPYLFGDTFSKEIDNPSAPAMKLSGSIPSKLFAGIQGNPATGNTDEPVAEDRAAVGMFKRTFNGCSELTGTVPADLFAGIKGEPTESLYDSTFSGCSGLSGEVPTDLFAGVGIRASTTAFKNSGVTTTCADGYLAYPTGFVVLGTDESSYTYAVKCIESFEPKFTVETTDTKKFFIYLSPKGTYFINWGDGTGQIIEKTDTAELRYEHEYKTKGSYTIGISGQATEYITENSTEEGRYITASIKFAEPVPGEDAERCPYVAGINGSLGAIFPTLIKGEKVTQPSFRYTFVNCANLKGTIPSDLFKGIYGQPQIAMFMGTFQDDYQLEGSIPSDLFAGIKGEYTANLFHDTFMFCRKLTGSIPENLFGDLGGSPKKQMFEGTFRGCSGLTGSIPKDLFGKIDGAPAERMFEHTFAGCTEIEGEIPSDLFGNIKGPAANRMFQKTFQDCKKLTGEVPESLYSGIETDNYIDIEKAMAEIFSGSGLITECPANQYYPGSVFEDDWNGKVFCEACPAGTTSPEGSVGIDACVGAVKLHIGEKDVMQLSSVRPESSPVMVFDIKGSKYYGLMSPDSDMPVSSSATTKYNVMYKGTKYKLHDFTAK